MQNITFNKDYLKKKKKKKSKHKYEWQEFAEKMTKWYKINCYWIFYRHTLSRIRQVFNEQKANEDREFKNLLYKLNNNHNNKKKVAELILKTYYKGKKKQAITMIDINKELLGSNAVNFLNSKLNL